MQEILSQLFSGVIGMFSLAGVKALIMFAERVKSSKGFFAYYLQDEPEGRDLSPAFFREAKRIL